MVHELVTAFNGAPALTYAPGIVMEHAGRVESYRVRFNLPMDDQGVSMAVIAYASAEVVFRLNPDKVTDPDTARVVWTDGVSILNAANNGALTPAQIEVLRSARTLFPGRIRIAIPLLACHQVRRLTPKNVQGFLLECGLPQWDCNPLIPILDAYARLAPALLRLDGMPPIIEATTWGRYHSALGSTGSVCQRVINDIGGMSNFIFSPAELAAVRASNADRRNLALAQDIPRRTVLICAVYLDVNGVLPEGWITGHKAINDAAATHVSVCREFFKQHKAISARKDALQAAADPVALARAAGGWLINNQAEHANFIRPAAAP